MWQRLKDIRLVHLRLNAQALAQILIALNITVFLALILSFLMPQSILELEENIQTGIIEEGKEDFADNGYLSSRPSLLEYLAEADNPELFGSLDVEQKVKKMQIEIAEEKTKQTLEEMVRALKLAGIIWAKSPQAMITSSETGKTGLYSAGDTIGDIKIKEVKKGLVILSFEGQEAQLR